METAFVTDSSTLAQEAVTEVLSLLETVYKVTTFSEAINVIAAITLTVDYVLIRPRFLNLHDFEVELVWEMAFDRVKLMRSEATSSNASPQI